MPKNKPIYVTQPSLPPLAEFVKSLEKIWDTKWIANNGPFHQELESELAKYLGVKYLSLFSNGTLALITALQALKITGEVITTPFSFVATTHSLWWNGIKPVFVDIERDFYNLDPRRIEAAITPKTTAIMPVHVYGNPCNIEAIQEIADRYGLQIIYDAAHAFGVTKGGNSVLNAGDLSILSFHATKTFNTIEGGAIVCNNEKTKKRIDFLKNFGFADELTVVAPGINAKMNEVQAAYGLLQLKTVDAATAKRKLLAQKYRELLKGLKGIRMLQDMEGVHHNYGYFPVLINREKFGIGRDELYDLLKKEDIFGRRYFYPLISQFPSYKALDSAAPSNLPVATEIANEVLCLPIYTELTIDELTRICSFVISAAR